MEVNVWVFITKIWLSSCTIGSNNANPIQVTAKENSVFNTEWMRAGDFRRREKKLADLFHKSKPKLKIGPERTWKYDPNWGYEPYWEGGEWVFDTLWYNGSMCGETCYPEYQEEGWVCGRNYKYEHRSFETYCHLKAIDCKGKAGWMFAYRGKCKAMFKTVNTAGKKIRKEVPLLKEEFLKKLRTTSVHIVTVKPKS